MIVEKIKELCKTKGVSVSEMEQAIGLSRGVTYKWDKNIPSVESVTKIADYFHISIDELMDRSNDGYYTSPEVAELTQTLKERPEMQILFDAARDVSREDIMFIIQMVDRMKK